MNKYSGIDNLEVMTEAENYNRFLVKLVLSNAKHGDSILDFGAGLGTFVIEIAKEEHNVLCVEPDQYQAGVLSEAGLKVFNFISEVADNSVDYVYSLNVLEHIEDDQTTLRELQRVLKPGGRLLLYVPALQILYSSMDKKVGHFRRYSRSQLSTLVAQTGFSVERCFYVDSAGFFASLWYKWFGDKTGGVNRRALIIYDRYIFPLSLLADRLLSHTLGKNAYIVAVKPLK